MSDSQIPNADLTPVSAPVQSQPETTGNVFEFTEATESAEPAESYRLSDSELETILFADPFAKDKTTKGTAKPDTTPAAQSVPAAQGVAAPATPAQGPKGQAAPAPVAAQAPAPVAPDPRDQELQTLKNELQQVRFLMNSTIAQQQQQQPPTQVPGQTPSPLADPNIPAYLFNLPDELLEGIQAEDPMIRKASLQAMIQGMAKSIHFEVMEHARKEMDQAIPTKVEGVISKSREYDGIRNDYFGTFPTHRAVAELVGSVTRQVMTETGAQQWSPMVRNAIGQRVNWYLAQATPQAVPQAPAAPQAPTAPLPVQAAATQQAPFIFGTSASPAVGPVSGSNPNAPLGIFDTLFG